MRILCEYEHCGPSFVTEGYRKVFEALGHEWRYWRRQHKPAFDAFSEYEPNLFLGRTFTTDRAVCKCIAARPNMRVVMYASAWGDLIDQIPLDQYPIVAASDGEKRLLEQLKAATGRPDFVWLHYHPNRIDATLGGWRSIGIEPVSLLNAADTFDYLGGTPRQELACDVAFVGGYWSYKARNLDPYILPLCHPTSGLRVKIFGNQPWPVAQYLGTARNDTVRDLFASAAVCPNVSEPHSTAFGFDVVERPFKLLAAGAFCVSDYVESMAKDIFTNSELVFGRTPGEFNELVRHYVARPEERTLFIERGRKLVLREHTYFNRTVTLLEKLGMVEEAARAAELHQKLVVGPSAGD